MGGRSATGTAATGGGEGGRGAGGAFGIGGAAGFGLGAGGNLGAGGIVGAGGDFVGGPGGLNGIAGSRGFDGGFDSGAADGGASTCAIPAGPTVPWTDITVTWCGAERSCAKCIWTSSGPSIGFIGAPTAPCTFPPMLCPSSGSGSGVPDGVFPRCSAHPDGEVYDGVLVQLSGTTTPIACSGLDNEGSGNLPDFNFDVTPCVLEDFTCVADCSACP